MPRVPIPVAAVMVTSVAYGTSVPSCPGTWAEPPEPPSEEKLYHGRGISGLSPLPRGAPRMHAMVANLDDTSIDKHHPAHTYVCMCVGHLHAIAGVMARRDWSTGRLVPAVGRVARSLFALFASPSEPVLLLATW